MFNNEDYIKFLSEWKNEREYDPFCWDGLINVEKWNNSSKIMFLLKESYGDFTEIHDLKNDKNRKIGPKGGSPQFWRNMRMYTYIIEEMIKGVIPEWEKGNLIREEPNDNIAYVNIKKLVEKNNTKSDNNDIKDFAEKDKEYLLKQINILSPKIIYCSGTYYLKDVIFGKESITKISKHLSLYNNILLIEYYHLSYPYISKEEAFNELTGILKDFLNKPFDTTTANN